MLVCVAPAGVSLFALRLLGLSEAVQSLGKLVLFSSADVGVIMLPLMIYHQIQMVVCAVIASRLSRGQPAET